MANWIKGAIKRPGSLHKEMGVPQGQPIPANKLAKAADAGGKLGQRAPDQTPAPICVASIQRSRRLQD